MSVIAKALLDEAPEGLRQKALSLLGAPTNCDCSATQRRALLPPGCSDVWLDPEGVEDLGDIFSGDADEEDVKAIEVGAKDATKKTEGLIAPEIKKALRRK